MKLKSRFLVFITAIGYFSLILRFFYWQIIKAKDLSNLVRSQHEKKSIESAYRGKILASDGTILVGQADSWNLFAEPKNISNTNLLISNLAPVLSADRFDKKLVKSEEERLRDLLSDNNKSWIPLKNRINSELKSEIESFKYTGIGFDRDETRSYPESSVGAHLLGFLGKDDKNKNKGYFGLEGFYDSTLSSSYGIEKRDIDIRGLPILFGKSKKVPSFSGADLLTYIDKGIQFIVDSELKLGIEKYGAVNGSVIVMDPGSGGILAMSTYPAFDPREYWEYSNEQFLNPVISASFEPGSIFKIIVMASAIDAGVIEPDTKCDICGGPLRVGEYEIQTWNNKYYSDSSMIDVIVHSDNVGMAFVAKRLGVEKSYKYLKDFGIGEKTGIDLQGEMSPGLRKIKEWSEIDLVTSSFGQGVALTPIQMIKSANIIANSGYMVTPKVVKELIIEGNSYETGRRDEKKRIISKDSAQKIGMMMVEAAKSGESKWTYKKGYGVAGKTGTAQIPIQGHYDEEKTIASFVGFAPYLDPKFIMLVTLREPKSSPWASETAAPLWYKIAEKLFLHFGIVPDK